MTPEDFRKWHNVWHAAHQPGSMVDFLNWTAANGYQLTKGEPLDPIDPEWAWTLAAEPEAVREGMDQGTARRVAKRMGGIAVEARWSAAKGKWETGGWASEAGKAWVVMDLSGRTVLADSEAGGK